MSGLFVDHSDALLRQKNPPCFAHTASLPVTVCGLWRLVFFDRAPLQKGPHLYGMS